MSKDYFNFEDIELWEDFRDGNREALNEIYRRNIDILYSYGAKITSDRALVEDSIQEVFMTLWVKRQKIQQTTSIKFYLFKSLKRRIFRDLKKTRKFGFQYDFSESDLEARLKDVPATEGLNELTIKKIHQSLNTLSDRQKEIIYLRFYAKLEFSDIADILEITVKATYKLQARAIQRLKDNFNFIFLFF